MTQEQTSFPAGIEFGAISRVISDQIYETPLAFIRENVQNAVDATRIQAHREGADSNSSNYRIDVTVEDKKIVVRDNGIGMSVNDLKAFFWTMGASGKRTQEAMDAGCVGTFGIGGFANFGVCEMLEVISQTEDCEHGTLTRLTKAEMQAAITSPYVHVEDSDFAKPRGTVVIGHLCDEPNLDELKRYLQDFVRYVPVAIYCNGQIISQTLFSDIEARENYAEIGSGTTEWCEGKFEFSGRLFEDRGHALAVRIESMSIDGETTNLEGFLRFEDGVISVFKNGFKLCATQVGSTIGMSGRLNCDFFIPTAGRDSLDSETASLLGRIVHMLEKIAVETVLECPKRIAQHTRIFRYIIRNSLVDKLGNVMVRLADSSEMPLGDIRTKAEQGVGIFFGITQKQTLNQIMQARGHMVVILSFDQHRRKAERLYLEKYCGAKPFDGMIDCMEHYNQLNRFEQIFLSELELNISRSYEVKEFSLTPGKLTEDIPVFMKEQSSGQPLEIIVDVRHHEIANLKDIGYTQILYSLIATFCREYLGESLKKWSPRFFGNGAINLELLAKRRSELWILAKDDIDVVPKRGKADVVTRADVKEVNVNEGQTQTEPSPQRREPRILHIIDEDGTTGTGGYYIRVPDTAFKAYGDLLPACENRGVVWAGNKITYVASDAMNAAFQYEIRLDELVTVDSGEEKRAEGAIALKRSLHEMYGGIYFPIPAPLEVFLVPVGDQEIRVYLYCEWIDMLSAKHWLPREPAS